MTAKTSRKLFIKTFGCQMNEYDSERMAELLRWSDDMQLTDRAEDADVLLLNTCSVRDKAQEKVFSQLGRWRLWKEKNPELKIGVGGCVASQEGEAILDRAPYVDIIFGPQSYHRLPQLLEQNRKLKQPSLDISFPEIEKFDRLPRHRSEGVKAFVSVMEGCSKYCTFCVVPYTRGEEFSRTFDDVLTEVYELVQQGVREVNLLGQNVNAYRGRKDDGNIADFSFLLRYLSEIEGLGRIRYTTSHPVDFSQALIDVYGDLAKLVNHLHLPVQSGSDRILGLMKRQYNVAEYKEIIRRIRTYRPDISLSSDFIVGFPGETDSDFEQTMALIEELGFDTSFSFIYSARPGTPAANLTDDVDHSIKQKRLQKLQASIVARAADISAAMIGSHQIILVDGVSRKNAQQVCGRTENNRVVNFDGSHELIGEFVKVKITDALPNSLRAVIA